MLRADPLRQLVQALAHLHRILVAHGRRQPGVGLHVARGGHRVLALDLEEVRRTLLRRRERGVELRVVRRVEQLEEDDDDRDHRDHHDDREEQPQPAAEGGLEQGHVRRSSRPAH
jgi:hypothetical protein